MFAMSIRPTSAAMRLALCTTYHCGRLASVGRLQYVREVWPRSDDANPFVSFTGSCRSPKCFFRILCREPQRVATTHCSGNNLTFAQDDRSRDELDYQLCRPPWTAPRACLSAVMLPVVLLSTPGVLTSFARMDEDESNLRRGRCKQTFRCSLGLLRMQLRSAWNGSRYSGARSLAQPS